MTWAFSDRTTDVVIGVSRVRGLLTPRSELGREAVRSLPVFRAADQDAWEESVERNRAVETWWSGLDEPVDDAFTLLPTLERPLRLLNADQSLDDVALFEMKRFLYAATQLVSAADGALSWLPIDWEHRLREAMARLHPQREPTPRFHLSSELDDRLGPARRRLKKARTAYRDRRRDVEAAVIADLGGTFDVRGRYVPPADRPTTDDARLLSIGGGHYELTDARVAELAEAVDAAVEEVASVESDVRRELSDWLRSDVSWLDDVRQALTELDVTLAKVLLRRRWEGTWGEWTDDATTTLVDGRLPRFIDTLADEEIQPISVDLDAAPTVVTGPNMGGKSALLELVAICQWCAQHAMPIPADRFVFTPVETLIYVGAEEPGGEAGTGLSAFGREVRRVVDGRTTAGPRLWLLDEFGRGTHPEEGASIAARLIDALNSEGDRVVFATHFPSLAALEQVRQLRIAGLTRPEKLREHPAVLDEIEQVLRAAMDFRPLVSAPDEDAVPRDARLVAEVLGLSFDQENSQ